jgi:hypothetical protein
MSTGSPEPTISVLSSTLFHCGMLFHLASAARDRCEGGESSEKGALTEDAIAAIVLSASAAEAFINELAEETAIHVNETAAAKARVDKTPIDVARIDTARSDAEARIELVAWTLQKLEDARAKTGDKFECASRVLGGRKPDLGGPPFQDAAMLFSLRNEIMHVKRKSVVDYVGNARSSPIPKGVQTLLERGLARETLFDRQTHWMFRLMTPGVARWAFSTSTALCDHVCELLPNAVYSGLFHQLQELIFDVNRIQTKSA